MYEKISLAIIDPQQLEALYRKNTREFKKHFLRVFKEHPNYPILQVWYERLFFKENDFSVKSYTTQNESTTMTGSFVPVWKWGELLFVLSLIMVAGTLLKLPHWIPALDEEIFYLRNLSFIIAGALSFILFSTAPVLQSYG